MGCLIRDLGNGVCTPACNTPVCGFDHWDCSTEANPAQLYVSAIQNGENVGTVEDPAWSLSAALALMELPWVRINLLPGTHSLSPGPTSSLLPYVNSNVTIQTYLCVGPNDPTGCSQDFAVILIASHTVSFTVSASLTFVNVVLDGALTVRPGCATCLYCPYTSLVGGVMYDDRGTVVDQNSVAPQSWCTPYNSLRFITVLGTLITRNVTFRNFRQQYLALIYSNSGNITLLNTTFSQIQVDMSQSTSAVIAQTQCTSLPYYCGSLTYIGGLVTLLNNGYEYRSALALSGFIYGLGFNSVTITSVNFNYNWVAGSQNVPTLINIRKVRTLTLQDCQFSNNIVVGGILQIYSDFIIPISYSNGVLLDHNLTHIKVQNCQFTNNTGTQANLQFTYTQDLQNIEIRNCSFTGIMSTDNAVLVMTAPSTLTSELQYGATRNITINGQIVAVYFPRRTLVMTNVTVQLCDFGGYMIYTLTHPNVYLSNSTIKNNGNFVVSFQNYVYPNFITNPLTYAQIIPSISLQLTRAGVVYCYNGGQCSLSYLTVINCSSRAGAIVLGSMNTAEAHHLTFTDNVNLSNLGSGLTITGPFASVDLYEIVSVRGRSDGGRGGLAVFSKAVDGKVTIRDSIFQDNFGQRSGGILVADAIDVTVKNVTFMRNSAVQNGGALGLRISSTATSVSFTVTDCAFTGNFNVLTGVLFFESTATKTVSTLLTLSKLTFTGNSANVASAIYIGVDLSLSPLSKISNCTFRENTSTQDGTVYLAFAGGSMVLDNCLFERNAANQGSGVYAGYASAPSFLMLSNSNFTGHIGVNGVVTVPASLQVPWLKTERNNFIDNACQAVKATDGRWTDTGSTFTNNTGTMGGAIELLSGSNVSITAATFTNNTATQYGGVVSVSESSYFECTGCTARWNQCGMKGGVVYGFNNATAVLRDVVMTNNTSHGQGSVLYLSASPIPSSITSSTLQGNTAQEFGLIILYEASLTISSSLIAENTASQLTAGIQAMSSTLTILGSTFRRQKGHYGAMMAASQFTTVFVSNCVLEDLQAIKKGGVVSASQTVRLTFENTEFRNIRGSGGGLINIDEESSLAMTECTVTSCSSSDSLILSNTGRITILTTSFRNTIGAVLYGKSLELLNISASVIEEVTASSSAITCVDCSTMTLSDTEITECKGSGLGGGLKIESNTGSSALSMLSNVTFRGNTATQGGGVAVSSGTFILTRSIFDSNAATNQGGGLFLSCSSNCTYNVSHTEFRGNNAELQGGAIQWTDIKPTLYNISYTENYAPYGADVASFPAGLLLQSLDELTLTSGQIMSEPLKVAVVDHYFKVVQTDFSSVISMYADDTVLLNGNMRYQVSEGVALVAGFQVTAEPGSWVTLRLSPDNWESEVSLSITAYMRYCEAGESQNGQVCEVCSYGYFSLRPDEQCTRCPSTAECLGNFTILPKAGYWRSSNMTTNILPCPNSKACIGSPSLSNSSLTGACADGYYGNLCNGCIAGHFRSDTNTCSNCPNQTISGILLTVFCLVLITVAVILIASSIRSATRPKSQLSIFMKIFMNYLQLIIACSNVRLNYPPELIEFSNAQGKVGNVDNEVFSIDCYFETPDSINTIKNKILIITVAPILVTFLAASIWLSVKIIRPHTSSVFSKGIASIIILFFLLHPTITRHAFSQFDCMTIDPGERWLVSNLNVRCWEDSHKEVALSLALPCLIIWVVTLPAVTLVYLATHRSKLDSVDAKLKFGFIVNGYTHSRFFWEFVVLYRKVLVVCLSVFLSGQSTDIQALSLMIVLIIAFILQRKNKPFVTEQLNNLESRGILVSAVTIYCGMFFISSDISRDAVLGLFAVIILINVYFVVYWLFLILGTSVMLLLRRCPRLHATVSRIGVVTSFVKHFEKNSRLTGVVVPVSSLLDITKEENRDSVLKPPHSSLDLQNEESSITRRQ